MSNNKNWPDRVYGYKSDLDGAFYHEKDDEMESLYGQAIEYILADKVREMQLATVKATVKLCAEQFSVDQTLVGACIAVIDPYSIIEQVKI